MKSFLTICVVLLFWMPALSQDYAEKQLEESPRHHEWITIDSNNRTLHNFVAYPERSDDAPVVIVIHENRGLDVWARSFADQLAAEGYIAIAPDLISNTVEGREKTDDFNSTDEAREAIYDLEPEMVTTDLNNVLQYARTVDAGDGTIAVAGFCWGGSQSFRFATTAGSKIDAALVFYGTGPEGDEEYSGIGSPVYGFYGGDDERVNSTIEHSEEMMEEYDKEFDYEIYEEAGHAYMRSGDDPEMEEDDPNKRARNESWERLKNILENL